MQEQDNSPVDIQLVSGGKFLYFFFGGIVAGIAMPVFEFYESSRILNHNKIFLRDFRQCWYQRGLPGIGTDVFSVQHFIQKQIDDIQPERVFYVGNSMGGYAAILFAALTGRGDAIAFAPQTFISPGLRLAYRDMRWPRQILKTYIRCAFKSRIWDLRELLLHTEGDHRISIFVSKDERLDHLHAMRLSGIPRVTIHEFEQGGHKVVKMLRDTGQLPQIMSGTYRMRG